jgi:hypothetical protein
LATDSGSSTIHSESLILDEAQNPIVAWSQSATPDHSRIYIKKWVNNQWEQVGQAIDGPTGFLLKRYVTLQWASPGKLAIAWSEADKSTSPLQVQICIKKWNTIDWEPLGPCIDARSKSDSDINPVLKFTQTGEPLLAWTANDHDFHIYVGRLRNDEWKLLSTGEYSTNVQGPYVSMLPDAAGAPIIAWHWGTGSGEDLSIGHWDENESQWFDFQFSAIPGTTTGVYSHTLQLDPSGLPVVAWGEVDNLLGGHIYVRRWNGIQWDSLDDASNAEAFTAIRSHSLQRTSSNELLLNWFKNTGPGEQIQVRRLNQ